jgi:hypothetical protein
MCVVEEMEEAETNVERSKNVGLSLPSEEEKMTAIPATGSELHDKVVALPVLRK